MPFVTGSYTNTGGNGAVNPFQTIERKDVGLTLRIKPQIGEGGTIRLVIYQENSTVVPSSRLSPQGLTTDKSAIETTVVVDDGQIMVLGGLLKDEYGGSVSQVPLLGDLPLIGALFRTDSRTPDEEQPDGLPAPDGDPQPGRIERTVDGPLRPDPDAAAGRGAAAAELRDADQRRADRAAAGAAGVRLAACRGARCRRCCRCPMALPPPQKASGVDAGDPEDELTAMGARHPLPYAFAKANTLLLEDDGQQLVLWAAERRVAAGAVGGAAPVRRRRDGARGRRHARRSASPSVYAGGESSAATVIGEVESAVDLRRMMQELPAIEDLLEASNDAPIIRMLNALLTQAAKDGA